MADHQPAAEAPVAVPVLKETRWRLIDSGFCDAADNMAIDEAIQLAHARGEAPPTLRFYGWQPPAVSVGYFQALADEVDLDACRRLGLGWVRRPTGGRAILHEHELTYSVAIREEFLPGGVVATYKELSKGLLAGLRLLGAEPEVAQEKLNLGGGASAACFDAPSLYELVVAGKKIAGSAQTRKESTILQHGSIPLRFDVVRLCSVLRLPERGRDRLVRSLAERATDVQTATGRIVNWTEARDAFAQGFAAALGLELTPGALSPAEEALARRIRAEKYGHDDWNLRR